MINTLFARKCDEIAPILLCKLQMEGELERKSAEEAKAAANELTAAKTAAADEATAAAKRESAWKRQAHITIYSHNCPYMVIINPFPRLGRPV